MYTTAKHIDKLLAGALGFSNINRGKRMDKRKSGICSFHHAIIGHVVEKLKKKNLLEKH